METKLDLLFKYYKEGKITAFTLCSELEEWMDPVTRIQFVISGDAPNFVVGVIPIKTDAGYKIQYVLNGNILKNNVLSSEEILEILSALKSNEYRFIKAFNDELKQIADVEITTRDVIQIYLKIYRMCIDKGYGTALYKIIDQKQMDLIDNTIVALEEFTESTEQIIENICVKGVCPVEYVEAAKKFVCSGGNVRRIVLGNEEMPDENLLVYEMGNIDKKFPDMEELDINRIDK